MASLECFDFHHQTYSCDGQSVYEAKLAIEDPGNASWGSNERFFGLTGRFVYCQSLNSCLLQSKDFTGAAIWLYFVGRF